MAETAPGQPGPRPLPPGLDLLWGRRERGRRGPRPGLSPDAIVSAAMRLADAEGLEAVSMARVAAELGASTMSLYRHVANKEELLQLMWNGSAVGAEKLVLEGDDWRARIRHWSVIQRDMIDRHPWITQMPMAAPPAAPNSLHFVELGLAALDGSGLTDADALRVVGLLSSYTLSEARMAADAVRAANAAAATAAELDGNGDGDPRSQEDITRETMDSYEALLREVVDEPTYPHLYRIAWQDPRPGPSSEREQFLWGVDMILDGVQALIDRTRGRPEAS
ncbi:MAG TPA: TetR/AcrR family transcriptional regulator [Trebonia sp.]|nr:TetR/AcrR family transcriptional regulator [Trebonia sp.]